MIYVVNHVVEKIVLLGGIDLAGLLGTDLLVQVGLIVKDVEVTKRKYAELLGLPVPENVDSGDFEVVKTVYKGEPAPLAGCTMAFFNVGTNVQIELIQPNEAPSTWREYLDAHGEGMHHIAFKVKKMDDAIAICQQQGMTLEQKGLYADASGCYTYMDATKDLKLILELLEDYK